jgi:hypothetical protein
MRMRNAYKDLERKPERNGPLLETYVQMEGYY